MTMKDAYELTPGVLASRQILGLVESGSIRVSNKYGKPEIGASALDLRLGKRAWKLREGQRPTTRDLASIQQQSVEIEVQHDTQGEYFDFDAKQIYLVQLDQILHLPRNVSGRATGKSSIGRPISSPDSYRATAVSTMSYLQATRGSYSSSSCRKPSVSGWRPAAA